MDFYEIETLSENEIFEWEFCLTERALGGAGLNFKILSRYFNFKSKDWYAVVHGENFDNLLLIQAKKPVVSESHQINPEEFKSDFVSNLVVNYEFQTFNNEDLVSWGFKNPVYEFDSENNVYFVDWSELPHDEEIKVIDLHDDYFFNIHFSNSEDVKNFFRFILKESYLFLNLKPSDAEILASENILFEHLSQDAIDCFFRFRVCKSQNSIMIGYETVSKNKLKKFLHITDKIKIQIL